MTKNKFFQLLFPVLLLLLTSLPGKAHTDPNPIIDIDALKTEEDFKQAYDELKDHVKELKTAKREATTKAEKEMVKNQIQQTKDEIQAVKAKALSGGIYIGSGALLLIIILLILL